MTTQTTPNVFPHSDVIPAALKQILSTTCSLELKEDPNDVAASAALRTQGALICIISLVGDVEWSLCLGFPQKTAEAISEKFFGMPLAFESSDLSDCIGEVTNIFAGEVKGRLDEIGVKADISLPSVIRGIGIKILVGRACPYACSYFDTAVGKLWYEAVGAGANVPTVKPGA